MSEIRVFHTLPETKKESLRLNVGLFQKEGMVFESSFFPGALAVLVSGKVFGIIYPQLSLSFSPILLDFS